MSLLINNSNPNATFLDAGANKVNLTYMSNFGLHASIAKYIELCSIFHAVHIDNSIIV